MKAISLISGGLDSLLATRLVLEQGVSVEGLHCVHAFGGDHDFFYKKKHQGEYSARKLAEQLKIKLHIIDVNEQMGKLLRGAKYGFGKNLNPCLDCKLMMIKVALGLLPAVNASFIISGEVVGQRGMSQRIDTMPLGSELTNDLIVRPLSAKLLPPTYPERMGWIEREKLFDWHGRNRKQQLALVKTWGMTYSPPAGGCLLTDPGFCRRLKDLMIHTPEYSKNDLWLLRVGRHYRLPEGKVIVGRDEVENEFLDNFASHGIRVQTVDFPGAVVLGEKNLSYDRLAKIALYFSKGRGKTGRMNFMINQVIEALDIDNSTEFSLSGNL